VSESLLSSPRRLVLPDEPLVEGETALRAWRDTDAGDLVRACQDPDIVRWTSVPPAYGDADARAYLRQRHDTTFAGLAAPFAIVATNSDRLLGSIALMRFAFEHARGEVGYWLAREARGHGHATAAVKLICSWGAAALGLERFDLFAATGNPASQAVAERAGFHREAVLRSYMRATYERQDMVAYGLLAAELGAEAARR
jgi:RimJ/RimL family protein N-acetyltransferase